jgi:transposase
MTKTDDRRDAETAIRENIDAIFVSLELSRSKWLLTAISPGAGEKISQHTLPAGDLYKLFGRFAEFQRKAEARTGRGYPIVAIQEAGLDGFWIDRALKREEVESYVVDPASIAVPRRARRAKTDRIDGKILLRTLMAFKRGEPRVCSMTRPPSVEEEDRRRLSRERGTLVKARTEQINRIKGLLSTQGVSGYEPIQRDRRRALEALRTGLNEPLPRRLKGQISRELDRLELLIDQIKTVEEERDALIAEREGEELSPAAKLAEFKSIGDETAAVIYLEGLYRHFDNRRQVAAYAGLAATPWQSGNIDREQGASKAGNARLRTTLIELAWRWVRLQPQSALTQWFDSRLKANGGRMKKTLIVALARKLLVALWKYLTAGVPIEGAIRKAA